MTNRPEDENRLRGLVDFDLLSDEEVDTMKDRADEKATAQDNELFFKTETVRKIYEHAKDNDFVIKLHHGRMA